MKDVLDFIGLWACALTIGIAFRSAPRALRRIAYRHERRARIWRGYSAEIEHAHLELARHARELANALELVA